MTQTVLVVDDVTDNIILLRDVLSDAGYQVRAATDGKAALEMALADPKPALILLDVMMPGIDGYTVCSQLKSNPATAHIPVIFVTAMDDPGDERRGFASGAVDYIVKPISPPLVLARVQAHISLVRAESLHDLACAAIRMLGDAAHYNDNDTGLHIWRMAAYARALAEAVGWEKESTHMMELAASMHDTGKIGIPDAILKASRKLTREEWRVMQTHSRIGHEILSRSENPVFQLAAEISLCHHERWDGSGYPQGLSGVEIPECARIVAIADVFDALTMKRPYKEPWGVDESLAEIRHCAGGQFEPRLVDRFLAIEKTIRGIKREWDAREHGASRFPVRHAV